MAEPDPKPSEAPAPPVAAPTVNTAPSATVIADTGVTRTDSAPGPEALPGEPLTADQKGKATVRPCWPVGEFAHSVEGVASPITAAGTEVAAAKVDALLAAAATAGTRLEVVS